VRVDDFDFELPDELIALRPAVPRDAARLLVVRPDGNPALEDLSVADLPGLLAPGDVLVFNDTRVIPARLHGRREREGGEGASIEATLHQRLGGSRWKTFVKPAKRVKRGDVIRFGGKGEACYLETLDATVEEKDENGEVTLAFAFTGPFLDDNIALYGEMPLPPYIAARRAVDERDRADYQTVYARSEGAVAAPTAGLHFTPELMQALQAIPIACEFVTLHVGAGTFLPVKVEDISAHRMHAEWGAISPAVATRLNRVRAAGGHIVAVGTTAARLLESAAAENGTISPFHGSTAIFIHPGYRFRAVDVLMTNFHLPRSSLFMLVSAFSGLDVMKAAYAHAIAKGYRFYSYGDASLLFPARHE
jgi:S-adenosylmethionine:tRNA ribosyltransferase-isomerase